LSVIASEAKQSIDPRKEKLDCFVAFAPRNDENWIHRIFLPGRYMMLRRLVSVMLISMTLASASFAADGKSHHLALHIDQNDPAVMNQTLNNATNVIEYYRGKNEEVDVDIVAYGPGLHMLRADTSPVQDRIRRLKDMVFPGKIQFSACNVTKQGMEKAEGHAISVVPDATVIPSGVVHLMELQEQGWSYVRP
jgi:intracellular sulfur oxidation DsrE/DsrF family protein